VVQCVIGRGRLLKPLGTTSNICYLQYLTYILHNCLTQGDLYIWFTEPPLKIRLKLLFLKFYLLSQINMIHNLFAGKNNEKTL